MEMNPESVPLSQLMEQTSHFIHHHSGKSGQGRILSYLCRHSPMSQRDLQERLHIRSGSLSEVLTKLESSGFITKKRDENDRRCCILSITDAGRADFEENETQRLARQNALYDVLTEQEKAELKRLLLKLHRSWDEKEGTGK